MVLAPVPERERRLAIELEAERALAERPHGLDQVGLEQQDREDGRASPSANPAAKRASAAQAATPPGTAAQSGASEQRGELRPAGERPSAPPRAQGEVASQKPQTSTAGMIVSFVFAFSAYAVNG